MWLISYVCGFCSSEQIITEVLCFTNSYINRSNKYTGARSKFIISIGYNVNDFVYYSANAT